VLERLACRNVVVHVADGNQRQRGGTGQVLQSLQMPLVLRPAMQFGDQVTASGEDLAVTLESRLLTVDRSLRERSSSRGARLLR